MTNEPATQLPDYLVPMTNDRGFQHLPPLVGGVLFPSEIKVYESSDASSPHIWLKVNAKNYYGVEQSARVHLTLDTATHLADQLMYLVHHHYQVRSDDA